MCSVGAWNSITPTLKFQIHVSTLIKSPGVGGEPRALQSCNKRHSQNHARLLDIDFFLDLEVFALETNKTNIKLYKVSAF